MNNAIIRSIDRIYATVNWAQKVQQILTDYRSEMYHGHCSTTDGQIKECQKDSSV